ncbi:MAG: hypothetical protein AAFS12_15020 [Cyanobacteria bacterium J06632_19]
MNEVANRNTRESSKEQALVLWFDDIGINDIPIVGGKNASLGEFLIFLSFNYVIQRL